MDNIVLIGMPSSGKSAVGALLAKRLGYGFIDSDLVIQGIEGKRLSAIIEERGAEGFLQVEERINGGLDVSRCVIATGGSVVYSDRAMKFFKRNGTIVYLQIDAETVKERIPDLVSRGVVMRGKLDCIEDLYRERVPLYERYQDITVNCNGKTLSEIAEEISKYTLE